MGNLTRAQSSMVAVGAGILEDPAAVQVAFDIATKTELASSAAGKGAELVEYQGATVEAALNERLPEIGTYALLRAYTGPVTAFLVRGVADIFDGGFGPFRVDADDTTSLDNGGTVLVDANGRRWKRDYAGAVNVKWFGAKGDGTTSDYAAFVAAYTAHPGQTIYMPEPSVGYKIDGKLTLPAWTIVAGNTRHGTKLIHAHSGDFAELGDGAGFENCLIDGQGGTFTGGCFVFSGTNGRQTRRGVRVLDFDGPVESFAAAAGSQSTAEDVRYSRRNAGSGTNRYAVVISSTQQLAAVPRKFIGYESDGSCSFDFGGCNNVYISSSFLGDLKYTADSRGVFITGSRLANQAALSVNGHNNTIVGCDIAPQVTVASGADNIAIQGNSYNNAPIIDASGNGYNLIDYWRVPYTPTITSGGTQPTLGDATLTGYASRSGNTVTVSINLTVGSTTSLGTGDLRFSLPSFAPTSRATPQWPGNAVMTRGGTYYYAPLQLPGGGNNWVRPIRDTTGSVTFNSPATWVAGDTFTLTFTYQV